jgi:crossover junction endodeoxyribonuclease RusA
MKMSAMLSEAQREVFFMIPLVPPSVNHYVKHTRTGIHYVTAEAKSFKEAVWVCCREKMPNANWIEIAVYLGKGQKLDVDNGNKVILDGLKEAGVIKSDASLKHLTIDLHRDWKAPRTELRLRIA